jgi:esterase/lipase superfamily enzyme
MTIKTMKAFSLVLLAALPAVLFGCATPQPHMMATPLIFKDERLDLNSLRPLELRTTKVPVFYATTRQPVPAGEPGHYSNKPGEEGVQLGVAEVALGEPGWTYDDLVASDRTSSADKPRPGRVERIEVIGNVRTGEARTDAEREFVERINGHIAKVQRPEVILYVHGYRVTFDEVAVMIGSSSLYLGQGATVAFQWPTGQIWWDYSDCSKAEKYIPDIARLIELLGQTRAEYINLLAYSCGSPLLASALQNLRARHPDEGRDKLTKRYRIGSVVFAASDVDFKTFAREHVPAIMDLAQQTTVYMSRADVPLGFSSFLSGSSRIGRPDFSELTVEDIEQLAADPRLNGIDVADVPGAHKMGGSRGHGYWYANDRIATDVLVSLRYPVPPEKRCLVRDERYKKIWRLPDDYPDCVVKSLIKALPQLLRGAGP